MNINANFQQRVLVDSKELEWTPSPMQGVYRRLLDRVGDERARATSIVRYAPNSLFSPHVHTGGEEFLVIDGVFQDEHGDYPVGSYIRNPPQSSHTPKSDEGCVILVKLWQFDLADKAHVRLRTDRMFSIPHKEYAGIAVTPLYKDTSEQVSIIDFEADAKISFKSLQGAEVFVMQGELLASNDLMTQYCWLRLPVGSSLNIKAGKQGAKIWLKTGHLNQVDQQIQHVLNL